MKLSKLLVSLAAAGLLLASVPDLSANAMSSHAKFNYLYKHSYLPKGLTGDVPSRVHIRYHGRRVFVNLPQNYGKHSTGFVDNHTKVSLNYIYKTYRSEHHHKIYRHVSHHKIHRRKMIRHHSHRRHGRHIRRHR